MEAGSQAAPAPRGSLLDRVPVWALAAVPLILIVLAIGLFAALDGPGLGERRGVPAEDLVVETTVLKPGEIDVTVRNDGPDAVTIAQAFVNDTYVPFTGAEEPVGRLAAETVKLRYPWIEGQAYEVVLITSTGGTIVHEIGVAVETPEADASFFGLMTLLGVYVGVLPVALGMLFLPLLGRLGGRFLPALMAFTVGLLGFLAVDGFLEGQELGAEGPQAFGGGTELVVLGAIAAFLFLSAADVLIERRRKSEADHGASATRLSLLIAIGIGLHNLGEGLAIGSAYAAGALALGAFLVIGFAIHNTTEGLAIVAPLAGRKPKLGLLVALGLAAGAPAILGAWIGASVTNPALHAALLGFGVGAIIQVVIKLVPLMRDAAGRYLHGDAVAGLLAGVVVLYATGLLISV